MYYIHHNPVGGEKRKINWIVNTVIILEKLGLVGRQWCKPVNYRQMINNWLLEVGKALICSVYCFPWYKDSHHDWFKGVSMTLNESQNSWKCNRQVFQAKAIQIQHFQCKWRMWQRGVAQWRTAEGSLTDNAQDSLQHFHKVLVFQLGPKEGRPSLTVTAYGWSLAALVYILPQMTFKLQ